MGGSGPVPCQVLLRGAHHPDLLQERVRLRALLESGELPKELIWP